MPADHGRVRAPAVVDAPLPLWDCGLGRGGGPPLFRGTVEDFDLNPPNMRE